MQEAEVILTRPPTQLLKKAVSQHITPPLLQDMEGACHCSVQPLSAVSDSDVDAARAETSGRATSPSGDTPGAEEQQQQEDPEAAAESEARTHHTAAHWAAGAALTVDSCMLADVLRSEGAPQLLRYFCCTHNVRWLEAYRGQGITAQLSASLARGDSCCRLTVQPAGLA
jgi:L-2-amino-thiazoline-4-carboxylic acid hydrolase